METKALIKPCNGGFNVLTGGEPMRRRQGTEMKPWVFPSETAAVKHLAGMCAGYNASFAPQRMTCTVTLASGEVMTVGGEE
jgi:hypothetical protein